MRLDQTAQSAGIDDIVWMPEQAEGARQAERKNVRASQTRPDPLQTRHAFGVWRAGEITCIDRPD